MFLDSCDGLYLTRLAAAVPPRPNPSAARPGHPSPRSPRPWWPLKKLKLKRGTESPSFHHLKFQSRIKDHSMILDDFEFVRVNTTRMLSLDLGDY